MKIVEINKIEIDHSGNLLVEPKYVNQYNEYIYRAAMGVRWKKEINCFQFPSPKELSYLDCYKQIHKAVKTELGDSLCISKNTIWINVSKSLKDNISQL